MKYVYGFLLGIAALCALSVLWLWTSPSQQAGSQGINAFLIVVLSGVGAGAFMLCLWIGSWYSFIAPPARKRSRPPDDPAMVRCLSCGASNFKGDADCRLCHAALPRG